MQLSITLIIVIITCIVSISAFSQQKLMDDLIFYPPAISRRRQYYRFITHGFIHADVMHLAFNMLALYSFGEHLETIFSFPCVFGHLGKLLYLLLYVSSLVIASLPDFFRYRDSYHFRSLGASGAVSGIVFAMIVFFPQSPIGIIFLPVQIPGYIFAIIYLAISVYLDKRGSSRINHSAHFWGAAYGIVFVLVFCRLFASDFDVYDNFMAQLRSSASDLVLICNYE
ncbi:MAG TPA: rhomboid family intramembrane serine protease [Flavisolibacter sp.]|nr:rhomboid family intramembrane serine protease [Flavisolibacter sp.]